MKKITLLALLALGLSFASCSKDRTCTCTATYTAVTTGGPDAGTVTGSAVNTTTLKDVSGKSARSNCLNTSMTYPSYPDGLGGTVTETYASTCELD